MEERLNKIEDFSIKKEGYLHLYGVAQFCALLALKRHENLELAVIAGMLHDIYTYSALDTLEHAHKGALMAREALTTLEIFTSSEIEKICTAIYYHSNKKLQHDPFTEVLIDADVLQHFLSEPLCEPYKKERKRLKRLSKELGFYFPKDNFDILKL